MPNTTNSTSTPTTTTTTNTIFASMRYRDPRAAIDWLHRAFGLTALVVHDGTDGTVTHAELTDGAGIIMLGAWRGESDPRRPGEGWAYVVVADLQDHHDRATAAGAEIVAPLDEQPYGSFYSARDPEGNLWSFGTYAPSLDPPAR